MAYFKLEFGFGRSKSEGKISDSANQADEQAVLEIPGTATCTTATAILCWAALLLASRCS